MPNTIILKATRLSDRREEGRCGAALYPGMLIARNSSGLLIPHGSAGGEALNAAEMLFAVEDSYVGKTINDPYGVGPPADLVFYHVAQNGDELYLRCQHGAGNNYALNAPVTSNGNGNLKVATGTNKVIGRVMEALDLTAAGAPAFVKVRIAF